MLVRSSASEASRLALSACSWAALACAASRTAPTSERAAASRSSCATAWRSSSTTSPTSSLDRVAHLGDPVGQGGVGFGDQVEVLGAGDQFVVVAGAEDDAGGVRRAALVDRHQPRREDRRGRGAGAPSRPPAWRARAVDFAGQLGGPLLAFGEQPGEPCLARFGGRGFAFGAGDLRLAFAQLGRQRARFLAGAGELAFERLGVGGAQRAAPGPARRPGAPRRPRQRRLRGDSF